MGIEKTTNYNLRLPRLISDGMVLQRDAEAKIWGWAAPGENVTVDFINKCYSTTADENGKWSVVLNKLKAGGPYDMKIKARTRITIKNVLVGDVWVCSGQSNMVIPMERVQVIYEDEIANCDNPYIRQFIVPDRYDFKRQQEDLESGSWQSAGTDTIFQFTAIGYFFAKALYEKYHVPIGLIKVCVGGTPVTAWMSEDALKKFPENLKTLKKLRADGYIDEVKKDEQATISEWYRSLNEDDKGLQKGEPAWFDPNYDASEWPTMRLPASFEDGGLEYLNGAVWFRKEINVPASMAGKKAKLWMGTIVDSDEAYINGTFVGSTGYQYPPRRYEVPENLLKVGRNVIALRVISNSGKGEFIKEKPYKLFNDDEVINLEGEWQYRVGVIAEKMQPPMTFFE